jgi:hypothetical protein
MPTLADIARDMLDSKQLNEWEEVTTSELATGADASRTIIVADLIDEDDDADTTTFGGWYAWVPATYEQKRVQTNTNFNPTTGAIITNGEFDAPLPAGTTVWLIRRLGMLKQRGRDGLRDAVNAACKDLAIRFEITLDSDTFDADSGSYDVSAYTWLTQDRILELRRQIGSNTDPWLIPGTPRLRANGSSKLLVPQVRATAGDTLTLVVARPASTYVQVRRTALATVTVTAGAVTAIAVADGGEGYLSTDTITVTIEGAGTGATATATRTGDEITAFVVTDGGAGYVQATTSATVSSPTGTWADSTVGLVNTEDRVSDQIDLDTYTTVALYHAFLGLATGPSENTIFWEAKAERQSVDAEIFKWKSVPKRERNDDLLEDDMGGAIDETNYAWPI